MSICLLIATCAVVMFVVWCRDRRCERINKWARNAVWPAGDALASEPPPDLFYHPGHSWARVLAEELVTLGATDFALNFAGQVVAIDLPKEQHRLRCGDVAWTLTSINGRRLTQTMPIDGKVLAVNDELLSDPGLAQRCPFDEGWILRVRPRDLPQAINNLMPAAAGAAWIAATGQRLNEQLCPILGEKPFADDVWLAGFGDSLDDSVWQEIKHDLFPGGRVPSGLPR
jgi:glycine cleavage system H protein